MPELPEVETVRRGFEKLLAGSTVIQSVELRRADLRTPIPPHLPQVLQGKPVVAVRRRAKYLLIDTPDYTVINHLGMSGSWRLWTEEGERPHDHVIIHLQDGRRLVFNDPRRFGILDLIPKESWQESPWLRHLGVEPLDDQLTPQYLKKAAQTRHVAVKSFIMDQKVVVGVGNIYASESLFLAGLRPTQRASRISEEQWGNWIKALRRVLQQSIRDGGTTLKDHRTVVGERGGFQNRLRVYDREGQPCRRCATRIQARVIGGRSTYWCPTCQR